jgi:hypothetical protein
MAQWRVWPSLIGQDVRAAFTLARMADYIADWFAETLGGHTA